MSAPIDFPVGSDLALVKKNVFYRREHYKTVGALCLQVSASSCACGGFFAHA